ncbi:hypothetical protein D5S17_24755 [Pseudonocardiaceae bacterium YIM PH 21723]|nr:hypothetical protein D5S17_24755 [Pseudonocardiaceae bacterium YIM PH 21723]
MNLQGVAVAAFVLAGALGMGFLPKAINATVPDRTFEIKPDTTRELKAQFGGRVTLHLGPLSGWSVIASGSESDLKVRRDDAQITFSAIGRVGDKGTAFDRRLRALDIGGSCEHTARLGDYHTRSGLDGFTGVCDRRDAYLVGKDDTALFAVGDHAATAVLAQAQIEHAR